MIGECGRGVCVPITHGSQGRHIVGKHISRRIRLLRDDLTSIIITAVVILIAVSSSWLSQNNITLKRMQYHVVVACCKMQEQAMIRAMNIAHI